MKNLLALIVLLAMGASFVGAVISLFSGQIITGIGLFIAAAVLNGFAKAMRA